MTTLNNVKRIVLKGNKIDDVDIEQIKLPKPKYVNGVLQYEDGKIVYEPSFDDLKAERILSEKALPIAYSLDTIPTTDPSNTNFNNYLITLTLANEMITKTETRPLQIYENLENKKVYQF